MNENLVNFDEKLNTYIYIFFWLCVTSIVLETYSRHVSENGILYVCRTNRKRARTKILRKMFVIKINILNQWFALSRGDVKKADEQSSRRGWEHYNNAKSCSDVHYCDTSTAALPWAAYSLLQ